MPASSTPARIRQHMLAALPFQDDAIYAISMKNMRQQQAGRSAADDRNLGPLHRRYHYHTEKKRDVGPGKAQ